jgi:transcriptional regulator with XRE-family HTH domain
MPSLYEHIGHRIRKLRVGYPKGTLSQEALAAKLKVASNTVSRWETGKYKPTPKDLDCLARFFSVPITTFFPDLATDDARVNALTSATGGLDDDDFQEVVRYAEFRKARRALEGAKRGKSKR